MMNDLARMVDDVSRTDHDVNLWIAGKDAADLCESSRGKPIVGVQPSKDISRSHAQSLVNRMTLATVRLAHPIF